MRATILASFAFTLTACVPGLEPKTDASNISGRWQGETQCVGEIGYVMDIEGLPSGDVEAKVLVDISKNVSEDLQASLNKEPDEDFSGSFHEDGFLTLTQAPFELEEEPTSEFGRVLVDLLNDSRTVIEGYVSEDFQQFNGEVVSGDCDPLTLTRVNQ